MNKLINAVIIIYFFLLGILLLLGSLVGLLVKFTAKAPDAYLHLYPFLKNIVVSPFVFYMMIMFWKRHPKRILYSIYILGFMMIETQIYRYFFVTDNQLDKTDLSNLLFFGIPLSFIYLSKYTNKDLMK